MADRDPATGRFLPGNKSGPGRPAGSVSLTAILREVLLQPGPKGRTYAAEIVRTLIEAAIKGEPRAIEFCFERIDGKESKAKDAEATGQVNLAQIAIQCLGAAEAHRDAVATDRRPVTGLPK